MRCKTIAHQSIHPSAHPYIHMYIHAHTYTQIHTYIHTCIHTYIHTYIHNKGYIELYIFCANTNQTSFQDCIIYTCLSYSRISVGEVSYLLASSIQQIIFYHSSFFHINRFFMICVTFFKSSVADSFIRFRLILSVVTTYFREV